MSGGSRNPLQRQLREVARGTVRDTFIYRELPQVHRAGKGKKLTALFAVADTIRTKARAALAEPARNCDMGTVKELNVRYTKFCYAHRSHEKGCGGCPLCGEPCCELAWAQLPYEEGGAE